MDVVLRIIQPHLPPALFDIILSTTSLISSFTSYLRNYDNNADPPEDWIGRLLYPETLLPPLSKILPPLISILAIYFTLISLYRTTALALRIGFFVVRWMIVLGVIATALGVGLGVVQPSVIAGLVNRSGILGGAGEGNARPNTRGRAAAAGGPTGEKPKVWDTWEAHQAWKGNNGGEDVEQTETQKVMKEIWVAGQNIVEDQGGWMKLVFGDGEETPAARRAGGTRPKNARPGGKGKGKANVR